MPRYVVLRHELPATATRKTHWDLLLERDGVLKAWALANEPATANEFDIEAVALADHRLVYLEYEGPIADDRGAVTRWDEGEYRDAQWTDERVVLELRGRRLRCRLELQAIADQRWIARLTTPADSIAADSV